MAEIAVLAVSAVHGDWQVSALSGDDGGVAVGVPGWAVIHATQWHSLRNAENVQDSPLQPMDA